MTIQTIDLSTIDLSGKSILQDISKTFHPPYIKKYDGFDPTTDTVLYGGPYWDNQELYAILDSVLNGNWVASGVRVEQFQREFSRMFNVKHSHMVNSGSSANLVMVTALKKWFKWADGDEIIVSPVGFPTTVAPIIQNNLKPVFVDIEMNSLNFDLDQVTQAITPRTRAIFVSPVLGNPPDMDYLKSLCEERNILLIGDNCDSLDTKYNGSQLSDYYFSWSTSFYPAHHISTGEGGMVSCNEEGFIDLARSISWWGRDCYCVGSNNTLCQGSCGKRFDKWLPDYDGIIDHKYIYGNIGYNLKPLDLQGAIGRVQLKKMAEITEKRRIHKTFIEQSLVKHIGITPVQVQPAAEPSWFGVPVVCESREQRNSLVKHLEDNRIQTRPYFGGNLLLHPAFRHLDDPKKYPKANSTLDLVFFMGCTPLYTQPVLDYIDHVISQWK